MEALCNREWENILHAEDQLWCVFIGGSWNIWESVKILNTFFPSGQSGPPQSLTVVDPIYFQAKINITILRSWCPLYCCFSWSVWNHWTIPMFKKCCQLLWSEVRVSVLYRLGQAHDDFLSASISTASNYCRLKTAAERTGSENPLYLSSARELQTRKWWVCCRGVANEHQS